VAHEASSGAVQPVYVSAGLAWEQEERALLERLLRAPAMGGRVAPLVTLGLDVTDLYPAAHWSIRGKPPGYDTPDEDVYLPGRNVLLLSKAAVFCATHQIPRLAMGPLAGNPFPDATPEFFDGMARALSLGLAHDLRIDAPFVGMHKAEVIRLGSTLGVPFELTLSCMNPAAGRHCGQCNKCRERRDAFAEAGVPDPTTYMARPRPEVRRG